MESNQQYLGTLYTNIKNTQLKSDVRYTFNTLNATIRGTFDTYRPENGIPNRAINIRKYERDGIPQKGDIYIPINFIESIRTYNIGPDTDIAYEINKWV